jgi:ISXO2 transposase-like protein
VGQGTARPTKHGLARAMAAREAGEPEPSGRVGVDDACLGGERPGGERGRGAAGKTPVGAAVGTTPEGRPRRLSGVVEGCREEEVEKLARRDLAAGAAIASDGPSRWPAVEEAGCGHFPMAAGPGTRAAGRTPSKGAGTTLGDIKAAIAGPDHHVSAEHARSCLTGSACRLDRRHRLDRIVERLARAAVHAGPQPYRAVTADA